jgi:DNA polymerase-3 subunit epsilon
MSDITEFQNKLDKKLSDRDKAISDARWILINPYCVLDTETTGLNNAQACQIAYVKSDGTQYKSLVKPTIPIEKEATAVHGISNEDVENAPDITEIQRFLPLYNLFVAYNAPFDLKVLQQSFLAHGLVYNDDYNNVYDAMQIYSAYKGDWDDYRGNYKWYKLGVACEQCGITMDLELHDAISDVIMIERLIKYIALQKLSTELE